MPATIMTECPHDWQTPGERLSIIETMEDWLGPTLAIVRCVHCGNHALLHLVAWQGQGLKQRIYAVRPIAAEVTATYLENMARDYCDLNRKQHETDALFQLSDDDALLIEARLPELAVIQVSPTSHNPKARPWQDIGAEEFPGWHARLT